MPVESLCHGRTEKTSSWVYKLRLIACHGDDRCDVSLVPTSSERYMLVHVGCAFMKKIVQTISAFEGRRMHTLACFFTRLQTNIGKEKTIKVSNGPAKFDPDGNGEVSIPKRHVSKKRSIIWI